MRVLYLIIGFSITLHIAEYSTIINITREQRLDALRKNKSVTMNTLHDICVILDCPIEAVVKIEKGDK